MPPPVPLAPFRPRLFSAMQGYGRDPVLANRQKLRIHTLLVSCFFVGGVAGALGFKYLGFVSTVPLAIGLWLLALRPFLKDVRQHLLAAGH